MVDGLHTHTHTSSDCGCFLLSPYLLFCRFDDILVHVSSKLGCLLKDNIALSIIADCAEQIVKKYTLVPLKA